MDKNLYNDNKAFTLAETLIVLVILGIIASITIPAVVRRQIEAQNRARIRKSMAVYDMGINKLVVENQFKSDEAIYQAIPIGDCSLTSGLFKVKRYSKDNNGVDNLCRFEVVDGVWWDISDILNPTIALNEDDLNNANNSTTFQMSATFDRNGSLRVNDRGYDPSDSLKKLWDFALNQKTKDSTPKTIRPRTICDGIDCYQYDEYGRQIAVYVSCSNNSPDNCYQKEIYDYKDGVKTYGVNCQGNTISSCDQNDLHYYTYDETTGWQTGAGCNSDGTGCGTLFAYENGVKTKRYGCENATDISGCTGFTEYYTYDETTGWQTGAGCNSDGTGCGTLFAYENGVMTCYWGCKNATDVSGCTGILYYSTYDQDTGFMTGGCQNKESCDPEHPNGANIIYND